VAQAIDALICLERVKDAEGKPGRIAEVRVDIARHKLARPGSIFLEYDVDTMDYTEVEPVDEPPSPEPVDDTPVFDRTKAGARISIRTGGGAGGFDGTKVANGLIKRLNLSR
jgi:hypothetical protein